MNEIECLILTTAHHRDDARLNRHLDTLNRRGINTTLIADNPGNPGRRFLLAPLVVWRHLRSLRPNAVLLPDPELYLAGTIVARVLGVRAIIDIHEDYAAVARDREWIPGFLRPLMSISTTLLITLGRRLANATVVAADHLRRRPNEWIVPNVPPIQWFPESTAPGARPAAVYVGDITVNRGAYEMVDLLAMVPDLHLELIGPITDRLRDDLLAKAQRTGSAERLHLAGRLPYVAAWQQADGAIAGLSLLRDTTAYREAVPTKVWEYMAMGLPVIGSALPWQAKLLNTTGGGTVVASAADAAEVLTAWLADPESGAAIGRKGRRAYEVKVGEDTGEAALIKAVSG